VRRLSILFLTSLLIAALPAVATAQAPGISRADQKDDRPPPPGVGGDRVIPAGYKGVAWGIGVEAIQAIKGPMELQITPDPHIKRLIQAPPPGSDAGVPVLHWVFWDEKLYEVTIFFPGPFTSREGRELVSKFESQYGPGRRDSKKKYLGRVNKRDSSMLEEVIEDKWIWQDPFSVQALWHDVLENQWKCVRQSRMYEASRQAQEEDERNVARSKRVRSIELD